MTREHDPASPCVKVCEMDPAAGLCRGCLRTLDEIAGWSSMGPQARAAVLRAVERRRAAARAIAAAVPPS